MCERYDMTNRFVTVQVEEHEAIPDGCSQRFRATGDAVPVHHVRYEPEDGGKESTWSVRGERADGTSVIAMVQPVDDSSAGTSMLVVGGDHGVRLTSESGEEAALPFLLLSRGAVVD